MSKEKFIGLDIVISHSKNSEELSEKGYAILSADGGAYTDAIKVPSINVYRFRYDLTAKDYQSVTLGLKKQLRHNNEKILDFFTELIIEFGAQKIAIVGRGVKYCVRHIVASHLLNSIATEISGVHVKSVTFIDGSADDFEAVAYTSQYYTQALSLQDSFDLAEVKDKFAEATWIFAKTMPHNPHEYTLRKNWTGKDPYGDFLRVATYLRMFGEFEEFGGVMWRITKIGEYKYWCCAFDNTNEKVDLINRAKILNPMDRTK